MQQVAHPIGADAFEHGAGHFVLGYDDVAPHAGDAGVFLVLGDQIGAGAAVAHNFEDDNRICDLRSATNWEGANDKSIRIADRVTGIDLEITAMVPARPAA